MFGVRRLKTRGTDLLQFTVTEKLPLVKSALGFKKTVYRRSENDSSPLSWSRFTLNPLLWMDSDKTKQSPTSQL